MSNTDMADPEQLPEIPPGTDLLDLIWRDMSPAAALLLQVLPENVDPAWATVAGIAKFCEADVLAERAKQAALATPHQSCLAKIRNRAACAAEVDAQDRVLLIAGALVERVRADWPSAAPEQLWLLMARRLRALCSEYGAMRQEQRQAATSHVVSPSDGTSK